MDNNILLKQFYKLNYQKRKAKLTPEEFKAYNRRAKQKQRETDKKEPTDANALINQLTKEIKEEIKNELADIEDPVKIKYYVKSKIEPKLIKAYNMKSLETLTQSLSLVPLSGNSKNKIKRASIIQYMKKIKNIYFLMAGEPLDINRLDFLKDPYAIINYIISKYGTETTTSMSYITAFAAITNRIEGYADEYEIFNKSMMELSKAYNIKINQNKLTAREKINYLPWADIINFTPENKPLNKLIYNLYTNLPPRRNDYQYMIIKFGSPDIADLDKKFNYYLPDQHKLIFNRYKTEDIYKTQIIDLTQEPTTYANYPVVKESLIKYIEEIKPDDNTPLIPNKYNRCYRTITPIIKDVFTIGGKKLSANLLRHSFLSWFLSKSRTNEIMNKVAYLMAHSTSTQSKYRRLDLLTVTFD